MRFVIIIIPLGFFVFLFVFFFNRCATSSFVGDVPPFRATTSVPVENAENSFTTSAKFAACEASRVYRVRF